VDADLPDQGGERKKKKRTGFVSVVAARGVWEGGERETTGRLKRDLASRTRDHRTKKKRERRSTGTDYYPTHFRSTCPADRQKRRRGQRCVIENELWRANDRKGEKQAAVRKLNLGADRVRREELDHTTFVT